jgi:hypothetical protein
VFIVEEIIDIAIRTDINAGFETIVLVELIIASAKLLPDDLLHRVPFRFGLFCILNVWPFRCRLYVGIEMQIRPMPEQFTRQIAVDFDPQCQPWITSWNWYY